VGKYCRAGQATDGNMAHAHCTLNNQGYTHTRARARARTHARTHETEYVLAHLLVFLRQ